MMGWGRPAKSLAAAATVPKVVPFKCYTQLGRLNPFGYRNLMGRF